METSLAYLQLQLGANKCPLDLDYDKWHFMVPLSWMKVLWKTLQVTGFEVHLSYETMELPRERDMIIMVWIMSACDDMDKLMAVARVRGFLNAIFLSDIVTADGKFIEEHALSELKNTQGDHVTIFQENIQQNKTG